MRPSAERVFAARMLAAGQGSGAVLLLTEPLNAWGGLDPATGQLMHQRHPQAGASVRGRVLVLTETRGSGTNSQVFAQALINGTGPAAVVLLHPDYVLAVGAIVASELGDGGLAVPVVTLPAESFAALRTGQRARVAARAGQATVAVTDPEAGSPCPR